MRRTKNILLIGQIDVGLILCDEQISRHSPGLKYLNSLRVDFYFFSKKADQPVTNFGSRDTHNTTSRPNKMDVMISANLKEEKKRQQNKHTDREINIWITSRLES